MKVSIIIPVYNCQEYIEKCLGSVINQTYRDIQVIVIDDGSTDRSPEIIDAFDDEGLVVIHQENSGVCVARNKGIEHATGDYLTFVDGDDYLESDYIERMVNEAKEHNSELVISGFIMESSNGSNRKEIIPGSYERNIDEMWAYRLSSAAGRLYSKELWDRFEIKYTLQEGVRGEDVPICILMNYAAKNISMLRYAGYHYIQHKDSAMHQFVGLKKYGFPYDAMDEVAEKWKSIEHHNSDEYRDIGIIKLFAQFYYYMGRGADKEIKREMLARFKTYLADNCPDYKRSWKGVKHRSSLPLTIRGAIELFVLRLSL